jgi:glycosyltransferase involved in cell wall biosynthesis
MKLRRSKMFDHEVNPDRIEKAELIVAIPSYNEADSISYPVFQVSEGLFRYFPDKTTVIINCDNNSPDNTKKTFLEAPAKVPKIYISTEPGVKGKGNNFRNLFQKVVDLEAKAIIVVDADVKSITPEWIKHLADPLYNGFAYVAPLYVRHKYDGTITNGIAYPMTRALYGRRVRQPIGGEFGFSGELAKTYIHSSIWDEAVANFGIDIWMTTVALSQGAAVCQSFMGRPKIHRPKDPAASLGPMFRQVVGTIFSLACQFESLWLKVKYSKPTAIYGFGLGEVEMPPKVDVDTEKLLNDFHRGFQEYGEIWESIFAKDISAKLLEIRGMKRTVFTFPTDLWARVLYDMVVGYRDNVFDRDLMMDSLVPLYFGRTFSFVKKTKRMSTRQAEDAIEEDCMTFEMTKPYFVKRWMEKKQ